jgi:hypothetical protein
MKSGGRATTYSSPAGGSGTLVTRWGERGRLTLGFTVGFGALWDGTEVLGFSAAEAKSMEHNVKTVVRVGMGVLVEPQVVGAFPEE